MSFEDRCSPRTTSSLNSEPNSPESTRSSPSPYTCTTITNHQQHQFLSITSYALTRNEVNKINNDITVKEEEPTIQQLKYSIRNILQPEFGKKALKKVATPKINFKPYEKSIAPLGSLCQTVSQIGKQSQPKITVKSPSISSSSGDEGSTTTTKGEDNKLPKLWPAWVYCTRYSDRPSSGPRSRRMKKVTKEVEEKRPRTAFSGAQLARLKNEFTENRYLTEKRRQHLSQELGLNEAQIKIWFQNKRAKIKKSSGHKNALAIQLMAQGLYNHSTVACDEDDLPLSS